ncbi:MAG: Lin0512 family protein [Pseudomonadota bacterium]
MTAASRKPRVILEMGAGNDLHGGDYTKAAIRAVEDALHHSSLSFVKSLGVDRSEIDVDVTIGVQKPESVDAMAVKSALPVGNVRVRVVKGGLDVPDPTHDDPAVIASAAIAVRAPIGDSG